ncbi:hypothetical protein D3C74_308990 [compost metagenome]
MCANNYIYRALANPFNRLVLLLAAAESAEYLDVKRIVGKTLAEGLIMLLGQNSRWHQYRNLFAFNRRFKSGTDRHLSLAVANVTAQQPVHWPVLLHVLLDFLNRPQLIARLLVGEHLFEFPLLLGILLKTIAQCALALGIELDKVVGDILH